MLDLSSNVPDLDASHGDFMDDGYPPELSQAAFAAFDRGQYSEAELEAGCQVWQGRALDEFRSQVGLTEFLAEMTELGLPFGALGAGARVVRDEVRHTELCRRMLGMLGGGHVIPGEPNWVRSDKRLPLRIRVLRTVVGSLCVGETLSVHMLNAARQRSENDLAHAAMTCLVSDESFHSRFGWSVLELLLPDLTQAERRDILGTLPYFMGSVDKAMHAFPKSTQTHPFGFLDRPSRLDTLNRYIRTDVIDRFEEIGLPGRAAWELRK